MSTLSKRLKKLRVFVSNWKRYGILVIKMPLKREMHSTMMRPAAIQGVVPYVRERLRTPTVQYSLSPDALQITPERMAEIMEKMKSTKSFARMLLEEIEASGMTTRDFYKKALIDRKLFSALVNKGDDYQPSRNTAVRCCLALHLSLEKSQVLMKAAGYALTGTKVSDLFVMYCIEKGIYNIFDVEILESYVNRSIVSR